MERKLISSPFFLLMRKEVKMFTKTLRLHGRLESLYPVPTLEHMSKVNRELEEYLSKG